MRYPDHIEHRVSTADMRPDLKAPLYTGRPDDRCQELACAYPSAVPGGLCRFHWLQRSGKIPRSRPKLSENNVVVGRYCV